MVCARMPTDLRTVTTQAVCSVREETDTNGTEPVLRQALNLEHLTQIILHGHIQEDSERAVKSGRKRSAPAAAGSKKRAKTDAPSPDCCLSKVLSTEAERKIPVYAHKFELAYTTAWNNGEIGVPAASQRRYANDERASNLGWLQEEKQFLHALSLGGSLNPLTFELGDVTLEDRWGIMQLYIGPRPQHGDDEHYYPPHLVSLPPCTFPKHQDDRAGNIFLTCSSLQRAGHISMSASASLLYIPGIAAPELPIQLHVTVYVSLLIPAIFSPPSFQVPSAFSIEGQRRRFLSYVFCDHAVPADGAFQEQGVEEGPKDPRHFYAILEPAPPITSLTIHGALQPQGLHATLLPFQRRTVKWLLEREGKTLDSRGHVVPHFEDSKTLPLFWRRVSIPVNSVTPMEASCHSTWYYNRLTGSLSEEIPPSDNILGAMLCEEMGLGKTLECIALILLNPATDRNPTTTRWDVETKLDVSPVKTNLIVTPTTLLRQWLDELARHAPGLKVLSYTGYNKVKFPRGFEADYQEVAEPSITHRLWCSYFQGFDVIVTTYNVLSQELGVAKAPIIRPKRQVASYSHVEKPRSPLVRVEWARVFMDEVQQVGGGKTAEMVSLVPRSVSIAVSGTPAKSKVSDLSHVLKFLRIESAIGSTKTWDSLLKPDFDDLFSELFKKYTVRTMKSRVKNELTIPSQRRFAVGIELGKAERHIYDLTLQEALDELGVDGRGIAASQEWQLDVSLLRSWLRRLRQVCTHPLVGIVRNRGAAVKAINTKTIKTIEEVLQSYQYQNWNSLITETKNKIQLRIHRAQLLQVVDDSLNNYHHARDLLLSAQPEIEQLLDDIKSAIAAHDKRGEEIIEEAAARRRERKDLDASHGSQANLSKGKGKEQDFDSSDGEENDPEHDGLPRTPLGDEHRSRRRNLQSRLREVYVLRHKVLFLLGDVYHILGISIQEEALYAAAEDVRKMLLKSAEESAISAIEKLPPRGGAALKKELELSFSQAGGIRSAHLMEEANEVLDVLNEQGELIWQWRANIFTLLTRKLSSTEGDHPDGEEYARTIDTQGEAEAYLQAYASLLADRKEVLISERTALAAHDAKELKVRETAAARIASMNTEHVEAVPENQVLKIELAEERKSLREERSKRALKDFYKAIMFQLSEIGNRAGERTEENYIAKTEAKRLCQIINDQGVVMEKFELELASFRKVFNERIQYFRQLQELSDSVIQPECKDDIRETVQSLEAEEEMAILRANAKRAGQRHFISLAKDRAEGELKEEDCVLCGEIFQRGLMTPCGHIFCEACLTRWLKHRGKQTHVDCPMCRSHVETEALQRISLNDDDYEKQLTKRDGPKSFSGRPIKFNTLPKSILDEIETFEAHGSYGSKITHLVRHLLFLQNQEPGTKSVVFSAWSDSLTIIQKALIDNGISCIRVDQKGKQDAAQVFKTDPGLLVFLLHGERENAGLNLTCAKRVWLIEPTVNHAFEVQAISRVDRMGQTSATEVFCYYIQDTVEENILRMGARRGRSLYTEDHSKDGINISEFAMGVQKAPVDSPSKKEKQKGDFIAQADDMIHVLFPHLDFQEEDLATLEDILPSDEENGRKSVVTEPSTTARLGQVNALAGPSRLR